MMKAKLTVDMVATENNPTLNMSNAKPCSAGTLLLVLQMLGLTLAYWGSGKLATFLAIPPGYATAIWPPSGIALAGILLYGYRVWPGIFVGSFLVNLSTSLAAVSDSEALSSVLVTLAISGGASLQAIGGTYLLRRYVNFPNPLAREKEVFSFLLFGGLFSSLVNSTIAVSTLVATARIPAANFLTNWGTWWLGDALGIFIFTPLMLIWLAQPAESWRNRRLAITLPIITMFVLTTVAVYYESQNESRRLKLAFDQQAARMNSALEISFLMHLNVLRSLGSFYAASTMVDRKGFNIFVAHTLDTMQGIQALGWDPRILSSEREAFETSLKQEGYQKNQITERNAEHQQVPAVQRPEYVPVSFIVPYQGNEAALGYDVYSDRLRHEAIDKARDSGEIATTARITLVQEQGKQYGVLAFLPIYRNSLPHQTLEQRQSNISGYIVGVFRGGDIVTAALNTLDRQGLSYRLIDESASSTEQLLFSSEADELKPFVLQEKGLFRINIDVDSRKVIPVGGRTWRFEIFPTQEFFTQHRSNTAWLILLSGLLLTSMVAVFTLVSSGRGSVLRRLVEQRTAALAQSEARFRSTFEAAPVGVATISLDGRLLNVNRGYCDLVGYSRDELLLMTFIQLSHPDYLQSYADTIKRTLAGEISSFTLEKQFIRKNGQPVWGNLAVQLIRDPEGIAEHFVAVVENIERRKQIEYSLHNLSLAVEQSPSSIIITDLEANIEYINETYVKATGYSREEIIGKNLRLLYSGKKSKTADDEMWAALKQGEVWQGELTNRTKNGVEYIESAMISPIRQVDGKITGYLSIKEDISERKTAEARLQESEQRFRIVADAAPVLIWLADTDKLCYWFNQTWLDYTGRAMEQEAGNGWAEGVHPEDLQRCLDVYVDHFDRRLPFHMEYRLKHIDGEYRWLHDNGVPRFDAAGVFAGYIGSCTDITDMRSAQDQLQTSHELFSNLSRQVPGMVYQFRIFADGHSSFPFATDGIREIYELTPAQVYEDGAAVFSILHPDDYDKMVATIQESANTLQPWQLEYRVYLPIKGLRWLSGLAQPERLEDGSTLWHGFITDITEQIVARNEARKIKKSLESILFSATEISIIATDAEGIITLFNRGAERMLGYSAGELVGKHTPAIFHSPEEVERRGRELSIERGYPVSGFNIFVEMAAQAGSETRVWTHVRKDQSSLKVSLVVTTIRNQNNEITGYLGIAEDITERKKAENERDLLLKIIEDAPDFIATADMQAHFKYLNTAGARLIGLPADFDLSTLSIKDVHPEWAANRVLAVGIPAVLSQGYWQGETALLHRDGREIAVSQLLLLHRDVTGKPQMLSMIMRDITQSKQVEQVLREAKDSAEAHANSKSEFLANMSHEIRTPMNAIIGLSQLALNKELSVDIRDYLEKIYSSSNSLLGILNDILDFSKLEAGRLRVEHSDFDLDVLLDKLSLLFTDQAAEKHLVFKMEIAADVPRSLVGDSLRLQQVLTNLLGNAIKFTEQGSVSLNISMSQNEKSQVRLLFCVADTGIGMSESGQKQLFQPFSQVDGSITRRFRGTGLGLAISHTLLQLMGGEFSVASNLGKGSCFSFELVLGVSPILLQRPPSAAPVEVGQLLVGKRILVAEDNRINQQVVCEFLKLSGIIVEIANNGEEALEWLKDSEFDAVLMDVHMPVMDGLAATKQIRSQAQFADLPVLALTAGVTQEEQEKCLASGMNDFIAKPINPEKLLSSLLHWLRLVDQTATIAETKLAKMVDSGELPDFNLQNLLVMLNNNQVQATQLLLMFRDSAKTLPDDLEAMILSGNRCSAKELVHKFKGSSGSIGALKLYAALEAVEIELNDELSAVSLVALTRAFNQILSVIASLQQLELPILPVSGNVEALELCATELDGLLKGNDFISEDLINTLKVTLTVPQFELFDQLRKQIKIYHYDEARKTLSQLTELTRSQEKP